MAAVDIAPARGEPEKPRPAGLLSCANGPPNDYDWLVVTELGADAEPLVLEPPELSALDAPVLADPVVLVVPEPPLDVLALDVPPPEVLVPAVPVPAALALP